MVNSNSFFGSYEILPMAPSRKQIFRDIFWFYHAIVCCVYSLESPHRGDSNEYKQHTITQHTITEDRKKNPELSPFASWPGVMINPQCFELPISRRNFHGPKAVRAFEVRLYIYIITWVCVWGGWGGGPKCEKTYLLTCASKEDSNQLADPHSLT